MTEVVALPTLRAAGPSMQGWLTSGLPNIVALQSPSGQPSITISNRSCSLKIPGGPQVPCLCVDA